MKKIITFLISILLIVLVVIALAPKRQLYNLAQHFMANEAIIFSGERIDDGLFSLRISDANIYVKDILVGQLKEMTLTPFIFTNMLTCKAFESSKELRSLVPLSIEKASVKHWVGQPYKLFINASGSFGEAKGFLNLQEKKVYLEIFSVPEFEKHIKTLAKKSEEGFYVYESGY